MTEVDNPHGLASYPETSSAKDCPLPPSRSTDTATPRLLNLPALSDILPGMTTGEARRHDLYNALTEFIGEDRADTLMAYLPSREASDLATTADVEGVGARVDDLNTRIDHLETRFDRMEDRLDSMNQRLDRLFLTLAAGLIAIVATVFAQAIL